MKKTPCIIVDDEPLAHEVLKEHIQKVENLKLVASCFNVNQAYAKLAEHKEIELIFLDIKMPGITGIEFLKSLRNAPHVIFTTANREFALEGFDLNAVDYILKPCSFERFLQGVNKVFALKQTNSIAETNEVSEEKADYLVLKVDGKLVKVRLEDILFVEAFGEYVKVYSKEKMYLTLSSLKSIEDKLPSRGFAKSHRSYVVALNHISFVEGNNIKIGTHEVPISRNLKDSFLEQFTQK